MKHFYQIGIAVLILCSSSANGQDILNSTIYPDTPYNTDSIFLIVDLQFNNTSCEFLGAQGNMSNDTFYIDVCHFEGMFAAICNVSDTILIGENLANGTYEIRLIVKNTGSMVDPNCSVANTSSDTAYISFDVTDEPTGIENIATSNSVTLINNLLYSKEIELLASTVVNGTFSVYNVSGQLEFEQEIHINSKNSLLIDLPAINNGFHFFTITENQRIMSKGKFVLID